MPRSYSPPRPPTLASFSSLFTNFIKILRLSLVQKEIDRKEKLQKHEAKKPAAGATAVAS